MTDCHRGTERRGGGGAEGQGTEGRRKGLRSGRLGCEVCPCPAMSLPPSLPPRPRYLGRPSLRPSSALTRRLQLNGCVKHSPSSRKKHASATSIRTRPLESGRRKPGPRYPEQPTKLPALFLRDLPRSEPRINGRSRLQFRAANNDRFVPERWKNAQQLAGP